jgi:hypothetical protein
MQQLGIGGAINEVGRNVNKFRVKGGYDIYLLPRLSNRRHIEPCLLLPRSNLHKCRKHYPCVVQPAKNSTLAPAALAAQFSV